MQLRVQRLERPALPDDGTPDDEHLGGWLSGLVRDALARGTAGPVAVVVRDTRVELVALFPAIAPMAPFLAGLTRSRPPAPPPGGAQVPDEPVRAIGVAGRFVVRRPGDRVGAPVALAFLEWPDCSWWCWRLLLDASGQPLPDGEQLTSAGAGDALPVGLGRWWSLQRRTGVTVGFGPPVVDAVPEAPHVH